MDNGSDEMDKKLEGILNDLIYEISEYFEELEAKYTKQIEDLEEQIENLKKEWFIKGGKEIERQKRT